MEEIKQEHNSSFGWFLIVFVFVVVVILLVSNQKPTNNDLEQLQKTNQEISTEETNEVNMPSEEKENKVQASIIKEGNGEMAKKGDIVLVNYTGSLPDGAVFDSNTDPKFNHVEPFEFTLGAGQVILGWDLGVVGMKIGEIRKLEIPSEFGYGATGVEGVIPPDSTLVFEVELLEIKK